MLSKQLRAPKLFFDSRASGWEGVLWIEAWWDVEDAWMMDRL